MSHDADSNSQLKNSGGQDTTPVSLQSQKASGSLRNCEQNIQNNNKMGGDLPRRPIRGEDCSSDQRQHHGDPHPPDQRQHHDDPPLRAVHPPDQHQGESHPPSQRQHHGDLPLRAMYPPGQHHGDPHPPGQRQHHGELPLRAMYPPDQHHGEPRHTDQRQHHGEPPLRAGQNRGEQHQHQSEPLRAVHPSDRIQHQNEQSHFSDQHQLRSGHNNKHPLSAPHIPVQGSSEAQLRQTQGRSGSQYHQSSTSRENIVTPPTFQPRQHSEQRNDNQHTDQLERHSDQHTDQRYQHTDHRERYSDQHTDQRERYSDQHTEQHTGQRDQYDQHTDQSKYTRPLSKAEPIPSNASNEGRRAIPPQSTGQPLPSKPVDNPQGDNPEKKELSDTGPCSVDVETSISGLNDLENPPTSLAPEPYTENPLVTDVDSEIKEMAAEVREEVKSRDFVATSVHEKPFDPNLVCPMCGKKHHIGDIQKFRIHVNQCDGVAV